MISAQGMARAGTYRKVKGKRSVWLVPIDENPHNIWTDPKDPSSQGCAGREVPFKLEDGSVHEVKGPWNSNADALLADTGIDFTKKFRVRVKVHDAEEFHRIHKGEKCGNGYIHDCEHGLLEMMEFENVEYMHDKTLEPELRQRWLKRHIRIVVLHFRPYVGQFMTSSAYSIGYEYADGK